MHFFVISLQSTLNIKKTDDLTGSDRFAGFCPDDFAQLTNEDYWIFKMLQNKEINKNSEIRISHYFIMPLKEQVYKRKISMSPFNNFFDIIFKKK